MAEESLKRRLREADDALAEAVRRAEETGELRHLHGKPLDLREESSEWLVNRFVKQAGFSHPLLEQGRELDTLRRQAEMILEKLRERRDWLAGAESRSTPQQAAAFNERREGALAEYRDLLIKLNRAIAEYNIGVPDALHRMPISVETAVGRAGSEIPALELVVPEPPARRPRRFRPFWRRRDTA